MQLLKALTPATGSAHASSQSCFTGSRACPDLLLRVSRGRAGSSSTVVLFGMLSYHYWYCSCCCCCLSCCAFLLYMLCAVIAHTGWSCAVGYIHRAT